ncbi:MAG TPA: hypothetical protein VLM11_23175 [Streptosporangiaceae bacterium]|nr:hypothetical protein [Streptosporangiaceae bacterium]
MESTDGTSGMDNRDTIQFGQPEPASGANASGPDPAQMPGPRKWTGRTRRVVTSVAAATVLLGSGAAVGVALTGGASAATGNTSPGTASTAAANTTTTAAALAGRCAKLAQRLQSHGHPVSAGRLKGFCRNPLLRLTLVGGAHGEVTFQTKNGPKTIAVERGTIEGVSSSNVTVQAKDGTTWTWDFATSTVVRNDHQAVGRDKLRTGETVLVAGPVVGGVHEARLIRIREGG